MDARSKIGSLEVDGKFIAILENLEKMSNELNELCIGQVRVGYDKASIEAKLEEMDDIISRNPVIENARIEGSADVQKIIDLLNQEVATRLQIIKDNFREADRPDFEQIGENFNKNKTNTMQKELADFDSANIKVKETSVRETELHTKVTSLDKRIKDAEKLNAIYTAHPSLGNDKNKLFETATLAQNDLTIIEGMLNAPTTNLKSADEYKNILKAMRTATYGKREGGKYNKPYSTKNLLDTLRSQVKDLEALKGNPEVDKLLTDLDGYFKYENPAGPDKGKIMGVKEDKFEEMRDTLETAKENINWEEVVTGATKSKTRPVVTKLKDMLEKRAVFDYYPEKKTRWLAILETENPDVVALKNEIENEVLASEKVEEFDDYLRRVDKDAAKIPALKLEQRDAKDAERNLRDLNSRHLTTTTREILGYKLKLDDEKDIASLSTQEDLEGLFLNLIEQARGTDEEKDDNEVLNAFNSEFENSAMVSPEQKNPGLLRRFFWKITHPSTWGTGEGLYEYNRNNWIKSKIMQDVSEIQRDAQKDTGAAWTLSPEKLEEIRKADEKIARNAKKAEREAMIKNGKTARDAQKDAQNTINKQQEEADRDMDL